jgi:hypothetical protein
VASTSGFRFFFARLLSVHGHIAKPRTHSIRPVPESILDPGPLPSTIDLTGVNPVPDQRPTPFTPPAALSAEASDRFTIANASTEKRDYSDTAVPGTLFEHH